MFDTRMSRAFGPATVLSCLCATFVVGAAHAEQVTLNSADGTIALTGNLDAFQDGNYIITTDMGQVLVPAATVACKGAACPAQPPEALVKFAGSDTVGEGLIPPLMSGFATYLKAELTSQAPADTVMDYTFTADEGFGDVWGNFTVTSTRSGDAFKALAGTSAEFGMSSRRILPEEAKALKELGAGSMIDPAQEHTIAIDSLAVIVNPELGIPAVSLEDLAQIYSGKVMNWVELGGPDLAIVPVHRPEGSGTRTTMEGAIFAGDIPDQAASVVVGETHADIATLVAETPGALGYVGMAFLQGSKTVSIENQCGIRSDADLFTVKAEEYPIDRRLYLYNKAALQSPAAQEFLKFLATPVAGQMIAQAGFADQDVLRKAQTPDDPRGTLLAAAKARATAFESKIIDALLAERADTDRLSKTFRFRAGSNDLDYRGMEDMQRLATFAATLPAGSKIRFVGFSDDQGILEPAVEQSKQRAEAVMAAFKTQLGETAANFDFAASGFGPLAPAACNDTEPNRRKNRRVEIWIDSQG